MVGESEANKEEVERYCWGTYRQSMVGFGGGKRHHFLVEQALSKFIYQRLKFDTRFWALFCFFLRRGGIESRYVRCLTRVCFMVVAMVCSVQAPR